MLNSDLEGDSVEGAAEGGERLTSVRADSLKEALLICMRRSLEISGMLSLRNNPERVKGVISRVQAVLSIVHSRVTIENREVYQKLREALETSLDLYDKISKSVEGVESIDSVESTLKRLEESVDSLLEVHSAVEMRLRSYRRILLGLSAAVTVLSVYVALAASRRFAAGLESLQVIPTITAFLMGISFAVMFQHPKFTNYSMIVLLPMAMLSAALAIAGGGAVLTWLGAGLILLSAAIMAYLVRWNLTSWTPSLEVKLEFKTPQPPEGEEEVEAVEEAPAELVEELKKLYARRYGSTGADILKFEVRSLMSEGRTEAEAYREIAKRLGVEGEEKQ